LPIKERCKGRKMAKGSQKEAVVGVMGKWRKKDDKHTLYH
jgi:hypothetical protein